MSEELKLKMAYIAKLVKKGQYRYTLHGAQQVIAREIERLEVEEAVEAGEIIEDYPQHHYGPACLILGQTKQGKVLHILFGLQPEVSIVTVYEPNLKEWKEDLKTRR